MGEEKVEDKIGIDSENNGGIKKTGRKRITRVRIVKYGKHFAVFAVAIMLISSFAVLVKAETYSTTVDVSSDLPWKQDFPSADVPIVDSDKIIIYLTNISEEINLLVNVSGTNKSLNIGLDRFDGKGYKDIGTIETSISNLFIITINTTSLLKIESVSTSTNGTIWINKIEGTSFPVPCEAKVVGRTFYQVAHGKHEFWNYAAEIQLPQENNLSVNITFAEDDLTYLTITNGSISKFGVCPKQDKDNPDEYMNISIYDYTQTFRLMSKEPVNFTLYVVDPVEEKENADILVLNISKTMFKDILVEKTFSLNTQNTSNTLKTILQELDKTQKKIEQNKYTQAEEWLNNAIDDIVILHNGVDERHIGMKYQTQMIIEYLNGVGNITADTKDMVLHRVNKSMDYLSYMFLYIYEPAIRVKPVREKLENVKEILEKKNTGALDEVINDLNTTLSLLDYSYLDEDEENNIMIQQPVFILYWLEMTKENLDAVVENDNINGVNGAVNLLQNVIGDLEEVVNTSTSEEKITEIVEQLESIDYNNPQPGLEGVLNMLENFLEHLDDNGASINRLEKIEERLENTVEDYEDGDINTSVLEEEINETVDELKGILTTINGVPLSFDATVKYELEDNDGDTMPKVTIHLSDIWLKYQPYPIFVTVDGSRDVCISDAYEVKYINDEEKTVGDVDDNDPTVPAIQPETILVGKVIYNIRYFESITAGFPIVKLFAENVTLTQTGSYSVTTQQSSFITVIPSPFSSKVTDLDQDGVSNNVEYSFKSNPLNSKLGQGFGEYDYTKIRDRDYRDEINLTKAFKDAPVLQSICSNSTVFLSTFDAEIKFIIDTVGGTYEFTETSNGERGADTKDGYNTTYGIYNFTLVTYAIVDIGNVSLLENALNIRLSNKTVNYTCIPSPIEETSNFSGQMVNYTFTETLTPGSYNITVTLDKNTFQNTSSLTIMPKKIIVDKNCTNTDDTIDEDGDGLLKDQEEENGTSPSNKDTDNDHFWDGAEVDFWNLTYGLSTDEKTQRVFITENVTNSSDFDNDGLLDGYEIMFYTNITNPDSDNDGLSDFDEVFQYFNVQKLEAEDDNCYSSGNKTDDGVRITSDESSAQAGLMYEILEGGNYRIKAVGSSQINANKTETNINMSIQMIQEKGYSYEEGYRALPNEYLSRGTDKILKENMQITTLGQMTTGSTLLTMNEPEKLGDLTEVDMKQGRYISLYASGEKGMQTINYALVSSQETYTLLDIDYITVERQGLDPWDPDTDKDGVMDGDEVIKYGTSPWVGDSDGDGIWDSEETCVFRLPQIDEDFSFSLSSPQGSTQLYIPLLGNSTPVRVNHASITINALPGTNYKEITSGYAMEPSIDYKVVDSNGVIHVVWSDDSSGKFQIYYRNSTDNGVTWNDVIRVSYSDYDCIQPDITVDGSGCVHVVWKIIKPGHWAPELPPLPVPPWRFWWFYKYQQNTFVLWSDGVNVNRDTGYSVSRDGDGYEFTPIDTSLISDIIKDGFRFRWKWVPGENWIMYKNLNTETEMELGHSDEIMAYPHIISTNSNTLHVIFSQGPVSYDPNIRLGNGSIMYMNSSDGGAFWSTLRSIGNTGCGGPNPNTIADSNEHVYVAWESNPFRYETEIRFTSSVNNGLDWSSEITLLPSTYNASAPCLAAGDGYLYLVFAGDQPYGVHRIECKKSGDFGDTWEWSSYITNSPGDCSNPKIDVDDNFNLHVVWQDNRTGKYKIYYEKRGANGDTLVDETPISFNNSVNPNIVSNSAVHVVWQSILSVSPKSETSKICYMAYDQSVVPTRVRVYVGDTGNEVFSSSVSGGGAAITDFCGVETIDVTNEVREYVSSHLNEYLTTNNVLSEDLLRYLSESNYTSSYYSMGVPIIVKADDGQLNLRVDLNIGGSQFYMTHTGDDEDNDDVFDAVELGYTDADPSTVTDPMSKDSDNDGIPDNEEDGDGNGKVDVGVETDPLNPDTDGDGIPDKWEIDHGVDPLLYDSNIDYDSDGLSNIQEYNMETEPWKSDTDSDHLSDSDEIMDILFRTNIRNGAVSVDGYKQLDDNTWVYYKDKTWSAGSSYVYSHAVFNATNKTEGWYGDECNQLVLTLKDGAEIYLNTTYNEMVYVWESKWMENRSYYQFNVSDVSVETSSSPVSGYKNMEIFYGPNPLVNDTDRDGVLDGLEYQWGQDSDSDGDINCLDRDSDNDGLTDSQEALEELIHPGSWWYNRNNQDDDNLPNMVDPDSDNDRIPDSVELTPLQDTDNDGLPNFIDIDSDNDTLWDSFYDKDSDGICDPDEFGEDINYNGIVDVGETSPIRWDSDNDQLSDWQEISSAVLWFEAENNVSGTTGIIVNDALASNNMSATNNTGDNQICTITSSVPDGAYLYYIRARLAPNIISGNLNVQISGVLNENIPISGDGYRWYVTNAFNVAGSVTLSLFGNCVYVDKGLLVKKNITTTDFVTDSLNPDTDYDGLNDGDEMQLVETDNLPNTYLTSPINPDCDNDSLLDGQEMKGWYIMVENGDEKHLMHVTSNPLMVDSDNDGLLDTEEIYNAVYWLGEAEKYRTNDTQLVDNNKAITNKTDTDEIYNVTLSVPNGTYQYYVRAKGDGTIMSLTVNCSGVFTNETFTLTGEYKWYSTEINVTDRATTMFTFGSVCVDKVMLVRTNTTIVNTFLDGSYEKTLTFDSAGEQTVFVSVPENTYTINATVDISESFVFNITEAGYATIYANGVDVSGNYAYIAGYPCGLYIINISNPHAPTIASVAEDYSTHANDVYVSGDYAYVVASDGNLTVFNVSDPCTPILTDAIVIGANPRRLYVSGDYAYVVDSGQGERGLVIINISDPYNLTEAGCYSDDFEGGIYESAMDVYVVGDYAYVTGFYLRLYIIDVSNHSNPVPVGYHTYDAYNYHGGIYVSGNYAYVAAGTHGLRIIDVSNPSADGMPGAQKSCYTTPGSAYDVQVVNHYAYVADNGSGLRVINVSDPCNPTEVGGIDTPGNAYAVHVSNGYAYIADDGSGLRIIDAVDYPRNVTLDIGGDDIIDWSYSDELTTTATMDISFALNHYLSTANDDNHDGVLVIPFVLHSDSPGQLIVSNININLQSFATNPMNSDTDYDGLYDGDEILWYEKDGIPNIYPSSPADSDTDNDLLGDGKEVGGWDITVETIDAVGRFSSLPSTVVTVPLVYDGIVFVGCANQKVYALDASNLHIIWESPLLDGDLSKYLSLDDTGVYVTTHISPDIPVNGTIYKLRINNGTILWSYQNGYSIVAGVDNDLVFVGYRAYQQDDGYMMALNSTTGNKVWGPIPITCFNTVLGALYAVDGQRVYITGNAGSGVKFMAISYDGVVLWSKSIGSAKHGEYLAVDNGDVFTIYASPDYSQSFSIRIYDAETGDVKGTYPVGEYGNFVITPNRIVITNNTGVYVYSRNDFSLLWDLLLDAGVYDEQPIVTGDTVIVAIKDNKINFIDIATGEIYRVEDVGINITSPLSLISGVSGGVYLGTDSGIRFIPFSTTDAGSGWVSYGGDFRHTGFVDCLRTNNYTVHVTSDPRNIDTDNDLIVDFLEYKRTNASNPDTDGDGLTDDLEYNVVFRTNATDEDYDIGTWISFDYDEDGSLERFDFIGSEEINSTGRIITKLPMKTPEGYDVYHAELTWIGQYDTYAYDVYVNGDYAYVVNGTLKIINISDPYNPSYVGGCGLPGGLARDIHVNGDYAYIVAYGPYSNDYLSIVDVSVPSSPSVMSITVVSDAMGIYVKGNYAYIACNGSGLKVYHISDPTSPMFLDSCTTPGSARDVYVSGGYAYIADAGAGLAIVDVSVPSNMVYWKNIDIPGYALGVYVSDNHVYLAGNGTGLWCLYVFDILGIPYGYVEGSYDTPGCTFDVYVSSGHAYIADGYGGLRMINVLNPSCPFEEYYWDTTDIARGVSVDGNYVYVADTNGGLKIFDTNYLGINHNSEWIWVDIPGDSDSAYRFSGKDGLSVKPLLPYAHNRQETYQMWTDPCDTDTDDDLMYDGNDGFHPAEDRDNDGFINPYTESDPLDQDTDDDRIMDGVEFIYYSLNETCNFDGYCNSDSDAYINIVDPDSDNDGLLDGEENDYDYYLDRSCEADPLDWDSDNDGLLDGAEPLWYVDSDDDGFINVWDQDSNYDDTIDSQQMIVIFRTNATDIDDDGCLDHIAGTWIAIDPDGSNNYADLSLQPYLYVAWDGSTSDIPVAITYFGETIYVTTPEGYSVTVSSDHTKIYIQTPNGILQYNSATVEGAELSIHSVPTSVGNSQNIYTLPNNYVANHQETYDCRLALNVDADNDGIPNWVEDDLGLNKLDADCDDDGIKDGDDIYALDPDSDDDGLTDGTEIGVVNPIPSYDILGIDGTDTTATFTDIFNNANRLTFTPDADPTTTTDPIKWDTDGDGLGDSEEDNGNGAGSVAYNGAFTLGETDPNNKDTDFDGINDKKDAHPFYADWDCDGILDGKDSKPENADHDGDGIPNSVELGLTSGITGENKKGRCYYGSDYSHDGFSFSPDKDPSTKTNPEKADTDGDGLTDGQEDKDFDGLFELTGGANGRETDPNNVDSDGDTIQDGVEDWHNRGILDADESDPTKIDTDSDGLLDNEEDKNKNGKWDSGETCAYKVDSDGDGLWDGYNISGHWGELTVGTDPLKYDTDGDSLWDGDELQVVDYDSYPNTYKTNPLSEDSDNDGISDYDEIMGYDVDIDYYSLEGRVTTPDLYGVTTNPLNPDSDGDGLSDGQEAKDGWTVMIAKQVDDEMITEEKIFKTNPMEHNDKLSLDSDRDGILDKDEIAMSGLCDYTPSTLSVWKSGNLSLYNAYEWFIENRAKKAWDDCSGTESEKWNAWNETIQSQFNPYVKENIPPIITEFRSDFDYDTKWYGVSFTINYLFGSYTVSVGLNIIEAIWVKTTVSVFDAGRISSLGISLSCGVSVPTLSWSGISYTRVNIDIGSKTYTDIVAGKNTFEFIKSVNGLTWALGQAVGYDAKVSVTDVGGESTSITLHRDGLLKKAWDFLTEIWNQFAGMVTAAVEFAKNMLNAIKNWVLDRLTEMLRPIIQGIKGISNSEVEQMLSDKDINAITSGAMDGSYSMEEIMNLLVVSLSLMAVLIASNFYVYALGLVPIMTFTLPFLAMFIISLDDITGVFKDTISEEAVIDAGSWGFILLGSGIGIYGVFKFIGRMSLASAAIATQNYIYGAFLIAQAFLIDGSTISLGLFFILIGMALRGWVEVKA